MVASADDEAHHADPAPGVSVGPDGLARTPWALGSDMLRQYYDTEWGLPVCDERGLFERLSLEAFQSGLSWSTVLAKRENFRQAFANFAPDAVAAFGEDDVDRLLTDVGIIRHRGKITATVNNAQATVRLREQGGLTRLIWSYQPATTPQPRTAAEVPTVSSESKALAARLRSEGFRFVGPTTMFALMEAVGMVDTHVLGSHRRGSSGISFADA